MTTGRALTAATALLATVALVAPPAAGADAPPGLLDGEPHVARVRPQLAELPKAPQKISKRQRAAGAAAVATCDPAAVAAQSKVATTERTADEPGACVVLPGAEGRALLAAALVSGDAIASVQRRRAGKGRYELVVRLTPRGTVLLAAVAPDVAARPQVLDVDGKVAGEATLDGDTVVVTPQADTGYTRDRADELVAALRDSRAEQLVDLSHGSGMNRHARELIADNPSSVDDKDGFKRACAGVRGEAQQTLVLGCYTGDRIHVLRVDQPNLATVMNVSLAHEMLHAGFDELSGSERKQVVKQLEAFMAETGDDRIEALLAEYEQTEPGARSTELHSLVGTQVADLPRALERHYRRYFNDRSTVVDEFATYQGVFDDLQARYDELRAQAESLEAQIGEADAAFQAAGADADRLYREIESLRNQGRIDESNALVDAQNAAADRANALVGQYNSLIDQYNAVVAELNTYAAALNESYNAISPEPIELPVEQ